MLRKNTYIRLNEIESNENLLIGNDIFTQDYSFYDEDNDMST